MVWVSKSCVLILQAGVGVGVCQKQKTTTLLGCLELLGTKSLKRGMLC